MHGLVCPESGFRAIKYRLNATLLCLFIVGAGGLNATAMDAGMRLVENNRACAAIVIPDKALVPEQFAAEELQYHVLKATGVQLAIYAETNKPSDSVGFIYIGNCRKTVEAGIDGQKLPPSGYVIKTLDGNLFLAGRDRMRGDLIEPKYVGNGWFANWQGTLFAVYDLLENEMGVRWLWPGELGEIIPQTPTIKLDKIDRSGGPRFLETRLGVPRYPDGLMGWSSAINKESFFREQDTFLLRHRFSAVQCFNIGHNFGGYWKRFGATHPEFFGLLPNGKREPLADDTSGSGISLCVSEPMLWKQIVSDWFASPERNPDHIPYRPLVNCCENDTFGMCTCEKCRSWDAPSPGFAKFDYWAKKIIPNSRWSDTISKGSWGEDLLAPEDESPSLSDRYARYYLEVLNEAKKVDKGAKVFGYAYVNYWKAPKSAKLNEDVIISYVPPTWFPYTEKQSQQFRENWDGWIKAGVTQMQLRPNLLHAGANLPIFYARRFAGDFSHAAANGMIATAFDSLLGAWSAQGPTLYTVTRIHEHPEWSVDQILDEYYSGFGQAKADVKKYFDFWEKHSDALDAKTVNRFGEEEREKNSSLPAGIFLNYVRIAHRLFSPEDFVQAHKLLAAAQRSANGDKLAEQRVAFLEKGLVDAELTTATRAAQAKLEKDASEENKVTFELAFKRLVDYRASAEGDNACNFGYMAFREKYGSGWPHVSK